MVAVVYPSGLAAYAVLAAATNLTTTPTALGSINLGIGNLTQSAASHLAVELVGVANNSTTLDVRIETSADDTNWFVQEPTFSINPIVSGTYRVEWGPFVRGEKTVRVMASTGTVGSTPGTVAIRARLVGTSKIPS